MHVISISALILSALLWAPLRVGLQETERTISSDEQFPWLVGVKGNSSRCSGIRIARRHVVTARHCLTIKGVYDGERSDHWDGQLLLLPNGQSVSLQMDIRHAGLSIPAAALYEEPPPYLTDAQLETFAAKHPLVLVGFGMTKGNVSHLSHGEASLLEAKCSNEAVAKKFGCRSGEFVTTDVAGGLRRGDSGGAVLASDGSTWYLAGMITGKHLSTGAIISIRLPAP